MADQKKRVVIVGAGIAGLTCAMKLGKFSEQLDVTVLEASDRIGGRINSHITDDGTVLELGAHNVHGTVDNPMYDFALEKGIFEKNLQHDGKVLNCFPKSMQVSDEVREKAVNIGMDYVEKILDDLVEGRYHGWERFTSLGHYLDFRCGEFLDQYKTNIEMSNALKVVFNFATRHYGDHNGSPTIYDLDQTAYRHYIDLKGELYFVPKRYLDVIDCIQSEIPQGSILKSHNVCRIEKTCNDEGKLEFNVVCSNGKRFLGDIVVLTVSLHVLKKMNSDDIFSPALPMRKVSSMEHVRLSKMTKLFFKFTKPFPREISNMAFFPALPKGEDKQSIYPTPFNNIISIERIKFSDWWLCWVGESLYPTFQKLGAVLFLKEAFAHLANTYDGFNANLQFDPSKLVYKDWMSDPCYQGCWSYIHVGGSKEEMRVTEKPIVYTKDDDSIYLLFAGEATECDMYSTTQGGFSSGLREAERILQIFNLTTPKDKSEK